MHISDKRFVSIKFNKLLPIKKAKKQIIFKWTKGLNRYFIKDDIQIINKHIKRCLTSLVIRNIQLKTKIRYHHTSPRIAKIKKTYYQVLTRIEHPGLLYIAGGGVIQFNHLGKLFGSLLES